MFKQTISKMGLGDAFTESFVRGVGKTSAVVLVAGVLAGAYYVVSSSSNLLLKRKSKPTKKATGVDKGVQYNEDAVDPSIEDQLEDAVTSSKQDTRIKAMFDSLSRAY